MGTNITRCNHEISIVLCGQAGQGIQTIEYFLMRIFKFSGYNVFATREYMSRIRGGMNSTEIRVSSNRTAAFIDKIDVLIPISRGAIKHLQKRVNQQTIILADKENIESDLKTDYLNLFYIPFNQLASEVGGAIFSNMVAAGVISGLFQIEQAIIYQLLQKFFMKKGKDIVEKNFTAVKKGYPIGKALLNSGKIELNFTQNEKINDELLVNGAECVGMGAIAGGCNFVSFYPMSPSTGVAAFLAQHSKDIVVEQVEDEISAINMAIGAWYAGGRALVTTSGGGFDLMAEGVSLSGMLETPVVIHIAQRPGPATGLPTRTEQGDIEIALYSGHGEFPRIIYAPGTLEQAFYLTQRAFNVADKFQIPVFILTDQYLIDSQQNIPRFDLSQVRNESYITKTQETYERYRLSRNGISPRGIPGFGTGLVCVDSDEHDEQGHITESMDVREKMVKKRLKKTESILKDAIPPLLIGNRSYRKLIIGWGSTYNVLTEAINLLSKSDLAFLHFSQIHPLHPDTESLLRSADNIIIFENNATSQFSKLIKLDTGITIQNKFLKYSGLPFSVEEVVEKLRKCV